MAINPEWKLPSSAMSSRQEEIPQVSYCLFILLLFSPSWCTWLNIVSVICCMCIPTAAHQRRWPWPCWIICLIAIHKQHPTCLAWANMAKSSWIRLWSMASDVRFVWARCLVTHFNLTGVPWQLIMGAWRSGFEGNFRMWVLCCWIITIMGSLYSTFRDSKYFRTLQNSVPKYSCTNQRHQMH